MRTVMAGGIAVRWAALTLIYHALFLAAHPTCRLPRQGRSRGRNCFNNMCFCTTTTADCSHRYGKLTFIPTLPASIQFLDFSFNNLTAIPEGFFANVTQIRYLSLSDNQIAHIHDQAFAELQRLSVLLIGYNYNLTQAALDPVFRLKSLTCVNMGHGILDALPGDLVGSSSLTNLRELYMFDNYIRKANLSALEYLPHLKTVDWGGNDASALYAGRMKSLENLYAADNTIYNFPDTCDLYSDGQSFFPRLKVLDLGNNHIHAIPNRVCLPSLTRLTLSGNQLPTLRHDMFATAHFPRLSHLYLDFMGTHLLAIKKNAFRNSELQMISLMFNKIHFSEHYYDEGSFLGLPKLKALQLSHNEFGGTSHKKFARLFGNLSELEALYLGGVNLGEITPQTFAFFPQLQTLNLYLNKLTVIPDGAFDSNVKLTTLQINDNRIRTIGANTFNEATRRRLSRLDISGNPFDCDCELRWFQKWLTSNASVFRQHKEPYMCANGNRSVADYFVADQACLLTPDTSKFIVATLSILILTVSLLAVLCRYRWHIRLALYQSFGGDSAELRRLRLRTICFSYDVYVAYASADLAWIRSELIPGLERRLKLKLCLHDRDFLLGANIADNIVDSVKASKKVMMVFSNEFQRDQWCLFELGFCMRYVMEFGDRLVIVCLDDVASRDMTSSMMAVLKTTSAIQWGDEMDAKNSFWGRLNIALEEVINI